MIILTLKSGAVYAKATITALNTDADVANAARVEITSNYAISDNMTQRNDGPPWTFTKGGVLTVASGKIFTFAAQPDIPGNYQVFAGSGAVTGLKEAKIDWWGTNTTPGSTDMSGAMSKALESGASIVIPPNTTYYFGSTVTHTGRVTVIGSGVTSRIKSDVMALRIINGSGSLIDNIDFSNVTAPYLIIRDPANWTASPTFSTTSAEIGWQPTVNDYDIWSSLTLAQQNQNIGPEINFTGNASDITVSRITGNFVNIVLESATNSVVRDCNIRGGKGYAGTIVFWNIDGQQGNSNRAINNVVRFPSYSGIAFSRNFDGQVEGNLVNNAGESGIKLWSFSANNGHWDTPDGPDVYCYNMSIVNNRTQFVWFDGFDLGSSYAQVTLRESRHMITGNKTLGNARTGMVSEGIHNTIVGNSAKNCGTFGMAFYRTDNSLISDNMMENNGLLPDTPNVWHELVLVGSGNTVTGNRIERGSVYSGAAIYEELSVSPTNYIAHNHAINASFAFADASGLHSSVLVGNHSSISPNMEFGNYLISASTPTPQESDIPAGTSYPYDAVVWTYDDVGNNLIGRVKYRNGQVRRAVVPLVYP
ncbi:tail spike protein [Geobacter sp. SVR]|uniref:tail spike protein n=1 Tax=Geobacter sp. SVR TaxID=2495594 RepID=UPI00143EFD03|nr:tail spike protein [Geobacter sp. SVR]BCS54790.1 hypothetical protein GSVR_30980 [Geobacter sp. SVR]GCF86402.1 hypothetical protein GSbR_30020 [Geobacter sp. SVR]